MSLIKLKEQSDKLDLVTLSRLGGSGGIATDDSYLVGGWRVVADVTARDAIPTGRRKVGMYVHTVSDGKIYELVGGTGNANWQEVTTPPVDDGNLIGGWRVVADTTARNAIPSARRKVGMYVNVLSEGKIYTLVGGIGDGNWQEVPSGGATPNYTLGTMQIPVDYATGYDGPAAGEVVFQRQADVDAYLASKSATAFKFMTKVWDNAIPQFVQHSVQFKLASGVHRPENPLPTAAAGAWDFSRRDLPPKVFVEGGQLAIIAASLDYYNQWTEVIGAQTITTNDNFGDGVTPPNITVSGTPFGANNSLIGYYAVTNNYFAARPIVANTNNQIWVLGSASGTPTSVKIMKPSVVLRNSYDDVNTVKNPAFYFDGTPSVMPANLYVSSIALEQMGSPAGMTLQDVSGSTYECLFDHAGQKNAFGKDGFGTCIRLISSKLDTGFTFWWCSVRGPAYATVPGSNNGTIITYAGRLSRSETNWLTLNASVIAGVTQQALDFDKGMLTFNSSRIVDITAYTVSMAVDDALIKTSSSQTPRTGWTRCSGAISGTRCDFWGDQSNVQMMMEGQAGAYPMFSFIASRSVNGPIYLKQGLTANAGIVLSLSNDCTMQFHASSDLVGSTTTLRLSSVDWSYSGSYRDFTWPQLDALRSVKIQPGGNLLGVVEVLDVDDGTNIGGNSNLQFVNATKLLSYQAYGDSGYGTGVDVSAGGDFVLRSANGYGIRVRVRRPSLPGADVTTTFQAVRGFHFAQYLNTRVSRRYT